MAQLDVHCNKGGLKDTIPFVVIVQSPLFDGYRRRMVVPLVRRTALLGGTSLAGSRMHPEFLIEPRKSNQVHSVVSQEVIASYAQKLNVHAVCERAASGQLLFLG